MSEKPSKNVNYRKEPTLLARRHKAIMAGALMMTPMLASAKISDWFQNVGGEVSIISSILVAILGAVGVVLVGFGIMSAISAKKNRQPMEHQPWLIVGGVLCVLLIPLVSGLGESISGDSPEGDINTLLNYESGPGNTPPPN